MARKKKAAHKPKANVAKAADHHPHFANLRHAGHDVAAAHHASTNPRPGKLEFSAPEEMAMRNSGAPEAPDGDADDVVGGPVEPGNDLD